MPIEEVIDKYNRKRILGIPAQCVSKKSMSCWVLEDDAQVDTEHGIRSVPTGTILVETEKDIVEVMSALEFNDLYLVTETTTDTGVDPIDGAEATVNGDEEEAIGDDTGEEETTVDED